MEYHKTVYAAWIESPTGETKYLGSEYESMFKAHIDNKYPGFWINPVIKACADQSTIILVAQDLDIVTGIK